MSRCNFSIPVPGGFAPPDPLALAELLLGIVPSAPAVRAPDLGELALPIPVAPAAPEFPVPTLADLVSLLTGPFMSVPAPRIGAPPLPTVGGFGLPSPSDLISLLTGPSVSIPSTRCLLDGDD